ncbi:hypothetical protein NX02_13855 [Sphingomonas sanxanigenens DSM 19645 = NX02]|uniref:Uncharacterized protein n=1 Tax=Sphingomonas sanxanigenens DSM 19645 = NX02 TaxID=1123269 RepID=W0A967_9SPHN|nr:hypothetical protein NX02_13855 [Sphingomonas sanxanigenens DSM 19645 = NX02]
MRIEVRIVEGGDASCEQVGANFGGSSSTAKLQIGRHAHSRSPTAISSLSLRSAGRTSGPDEPRAGMSGTKLRAPPAQSGDVM